MEKSKYRVDMVKVKRHDCAAPYLRLVRDEIKRGCGFVSVYESKGGKANIYAFDTLSYIMGGVWVPEEALIPA